MDLLEQLCLPKVDSAVLLLQKVLKQFSLIVILVWKWCHIVCSPRGRVKNDVRVFSLRDIIILWFWVCLNEGQDVLDPPAAILLSPCVSYSFTPVWGVKSGDLGVKILASLQMIEKILAFSRTCEYHLFLIFILLETLIFGGRRLPSLLIFRLLVLCMEWLNLLYNLFLNLLFCICNINTPLQNILSVHST
jgi:hypothetical protein